MALTLKQLEAAAFWQSRVCLACEAIVDDEEAEACPLCEEQPLIPADVVKKCAEIVNREEE